MKRDHSARMLMLMFVLISLHGLTNRSFAQAPGDVNADGIINLADVGLIADRLLGRNQLTGGPLARADANADGNINVADLVWTINRRSGLNHSMSIDADPVQAGQYVLVTLAATNLSTQPLTNVTLNLIIPAFSDYGSFNPGETYGVNQGTLGIGGTTSITIPLRIRSGASAPPDGTVLHFASFVTSTQGPRADVAKQITVRNSRPLILGLTTDISPVESGQRIRYTVLFGNRGIQALSNAQLRMPLPFGLDDPEVDEGGSINLRTATWNLGTLAAGQTGQVHLHGTVTDHLDEGELILAEAELGAGGESAHVELATPLLNASPLVFDISADDDPVIPGQHLNLRMTVINRGAQPLSGVTINLIIPEYADYGSFNPGQILPLAIGALNPGQIVTRTIPLQVRSGSTAPPDGIILRIAGFARSTQGHQADARRDVTVNNLSKIEVGIATDINPAEPDRGLTYTVHYANRDIVSVAGCVLRMQVPPGIVFPAADEGGVIENGWVTWTLGTLAAGQAGEVHLTGIVAGLEGSVIRAEARLRSGTRSAYSMIATPVKASQPLVFQLSSTSDPIYPGQIVQLSLTVTNRGSQPLTDVTHHLAIPDFADTGSFNPGEVYSTTVGTLQAGQSQTTFLSLQVRSGGNAPPAGSMLRLNAWAESGQGYRADIVRDLPVNAAPVLDLAIETDRNPAAAGAELIYTLHYGNRGLFSIAGTSLRMRIPPKLGTPVADHGGVIGNGWATWDLGTLEQGESGQVRLAGVVNGALAGGELLRADAVLESGSTSARSAIVTAVRVTQPLLFDIAVNSEPVYQGQALQLTWTATNRGDQPLTAVELRLLMGDYLDLGSINPGETFLRTVGTLAPGQSFSEVLPLYVRSGTSAPPTGEVLHLKAWATSAQGYRSDLARAIAVDNAAGLDTGIVTNTDPAIPGAPLAYTLHYGNHSSSAIAGAALHMALPRGLESPVADHGGVVAGGGVTWNLGTLTAGESGQVHLAGTVAAGLVSGDILRADSALEAGSRSARSAVATAIRAPRSPLLFSVTADADPVYPGQHAHLTLSASNTSTQTLNDVRIMTVMSDYADAGSINPGEIYTRVVGNLAAGQNYTETLPVRIRSGATAPPAGEILHLKSWVSSAQGHRAILGRDLAVENAVDLDIGLTGNRSPAAPGEELVYTIRYGNPGGLAASSARLRLELPGGVSAPVTDGGATVSGRVVTWELGDLASGQGGEVHATVTVNSLPAGELLNARASIASGVEEAYATLATALHAASPLLFEVTETSGTVAAAQVVNVTLKVTNNGGQALNDAAVNLLMSQYADAGSINPGETYSSNLGTLAPAATAMVNLPITIRTGGNAPPVGTVLHLSTWATSAQGYRSDLKRNLRVGN